MGYVTPIIQLKYSSSYLQFQGLYTSAFIVLLMVMHGKKTRKERYAITNVAALVMSVLGYLYRRLKTQTDDNIRYILATAHLSLAIRRVIEAFIIYPDEMSPQLYYTPGNPFHGGLNAAKEYIYTVSYICQRSCEIFLNSMIHSSTR